ncbi:MAG: hypothetical protein OEV49_05675 [candidate division Zixibacteria bacterium]|nr:hypothetical protein [candidate division Zixibacteria bacterium]MDH3936249.1 hypothetical protein [candidate division Zixibacteria bacterium]MDH4034876.1 hypothetical protein [candidate division Zixibacteria bacterium]
MIDKRLAGIYLLMEELGGFGIDDLEDRVFVQKAIYLLQVLGIDLRYRFSWYLRGPYSTHLTQSVFELTSNKSMQDEAKKLTIRPEVRPAINKLKKLMEAKPESLTPSSWLELLGSIHYLKHISKAIASKDVAGAILGRAGKDWFSDEEAVAAWDQLDSVGLIGNIKLPL